MNATTDDALQVSPLPPAGWRRPPRWLIRQILVLGAIACIAFLARFFLIPPKYTATATLRVKMMRPKILFPTAEQEPEYAIFQKTQIALILSNKVLDPVVTGEAFPVGGEFATKKEKIANLRTIRQVVAHNEDPAQWLQHELTVEFPNKSEILQISLSGEYREDLPKIVNKVVDVYMSQVVEAEKKERAVRVDNLKGLWTRYEKNLKETRDALRKQAEKLGSGDKDVQSVTDQFIHKELDKVDHQLVWVDHALLELKLPAVAAQTRLSRRRAEHAAKEEIGKLEDEVAVIDAQVKSLQDDRETLRREAAELNQKAATLGKDTLDYQGTQEEFAVQSETAKKVKAEVEAMDVELKAPDRIELIDLARPPTNRSWPW